MMAVERDESRNPELIRLLQSASKSESKAAPEPAEDADPLSGEWTGSESSCLLKLIAEYEYLPQIESKNLQVYTKLSKLMTISGYQKSGEEIRRHWGDLTLKYDAVKAGKATRFDCLEQMGDLLDCKWKSRSEPEIIIVKGEELASDYVDSDIECEQRNGRGIRRNNWSHKEVECIIQVLEKYGMPSRTNLRKFCYVIVDYLKQHGFSRSEEQAQVKIKHLRALYNQVMRKCLKEEEFPFFKRIQLLIQTQEAESNRRESESQNYIALDEYSKSDMEDNVAADFNEHIEAVEEEETFYKKGRQIWTKKEIGVLLKFIEENGIITGKQLRKVCNKAVDYLASYGYYRSATQILIRWKNTKALYWATFRKKSKLPERECSFFYRLHAILNPDGGTYEPKNFEEATKGTNFIHFNNVKLESSPESLPFHFSEMLHQPASFNFKRENFVALQSNSSSDDNFVPLQNVPSAKRFRANNATADPLENGSDGRVILSSPKRSHTEHAADLMQMGSCSYCNSLDPIDHYCISLAHSIKKLSARKQAKLKIEIQQLMYRAEFDSDF